MPLLPCLLVFIPPHVRSCQHYSVSVFVCHLGANRNLNTRVLFIIKFLRDCAQLLRCLKQFLPAVLRHRQRDSLSFQDIPRSYLYNWYIYIKTVMTGPTRKASTNSRQKKGTSFAFLSGVLDQPTTSRRTIWEASYVASMQRAEWLSISGTIHQTCCIFVFHFVVVFFGLRLQFFLE